MDARWLGEVGLADEGVYDDTLAVLVSNWFRLRGLAGGDAGLDLGAGLLDSVDIWCFEEMRYDDTLCVL